MRNVTRVMGGAGLLVLAFIALIWLATAIDMGVPYFQGEVNPYHPDKPGPQPERGVWIAHFLFALAAIAFAGRTIWRLGRRLFTEDRPDHLRRDSAIVFVAFWISMFMVLAWNANGW